MKRNAKSRKKSPSKNQGKKRTKSRRNSSRKANARSREKKETIESRRSRRKANEKADETQIKRRRKKKKSRSHQHTTQETKCGEGTIKTNGERRSSSGQSGVRGADKMRMTESNRPSSIEPLREENKAGTDRRRPVLFTNFYQQRRTLPPAQVCFIWSVSLFRSVLLLLATTHWANFLSCLFFFQHIRA